MIFSKSDYEALIEGPMLVLRPRGRQGSVAIITPPRVKPQLYILPALLIVKAGFEVRMPVASMPCNWRARAELARLISRNVDITVEIGNFCLCTGRAEVHVAFRDIEGHVKAYHVPSSDTILDGSCGSITVKCDAPIEVVNVDGDVIMLDHAIYIRDAVIRLFKKGQSPL